MPVAYEKIAARNVERLAALSDGLFAIAMTLLIIDLHTPAAEAIRSEQELFHALIHLTPQIVMYFIGFMTLGIFWIAQQSQIDAFARLDRAAHADRAMVAQRRVALPLAAHRTYVGRTGRSGDKVPCPSRRDHASAPAIA